MTIRMRFFVTILLFMLCAGCLFGVMCVSAEDDNTIDTKLTLSGFSSGLTRTHNNGVDYVAISNKGFYATMPLNEVYVDGEENWTGGVRFRPTSGAVKLNGNNANGVSILKYGATSYYVEGFTLSAGDVLQFDGVFYNDANGNGRRDNGEIALDIAATRIVYDGDKYVQQTVVVNEQYSSFSMVKGASVRLNAGTGLKFAATLSQADYTILAEQNATFGFAFVRADDVIGGKLTADDLFGIDATFGNGTQKTLITTLAPPVEVNGVYRMEGCLRDVSDVYTEYVAVAYAKVGNNYTLAKFWANDMSYNTRSCYYAAQLAIDDGDSSAQTIQAQYIDVAAPHTETLTVKAMLLGNGKIVDIETASQVAVNSVQRVVAPDKDGYELVGDSEVQVKIYANRPQTVTFVYEDRTERNMALSAFAPPKLDSRNNYDNATNRQIIADIKAAGLNTFVLSTLGNITTQDDVDKIKTIADMFWQYDIKTVVDFKKLYYALDEYPDFSDCEGIEGVFHFDEPNYAQIDTVLADFAQDFNATYGADPNKVFMSNLFPYEAERFGALGNDGNGNSVTYAQYVERYCQSVANIVNGTKYLSVDTYPILKNGQLDGDFLASLGYLRYFADKYDCYANVCLQSSGFNEGYDTKERLPTEEEMRMQAYAALAFGMDGISWFTYASVAAIGQNATNTPVEFATGNKGNGYDSLTAVNQELSAFADVYNTYDWRGVMFLNEQNYSAATAKLSEVDFSTKRLTANDTLFSAVNATSSAICGVFDSNNSSKQGYAFVNYNAPRSGTGTSITLTVSSPVSITIYRNGITQNVVVDGTYTIELGSGEGCFVTATRVQGLLTAEQIKNLADCTALMKARIRTTTSATEHIGDFYFDTSITDGVRKTLFNNWVIFDGNDFDENCFVELPAFDFSQYNRVEFGVRLDSAGGINNVKVCGTSVDGIVPIVNALFVVRTSNGQTTLEILDVRTLNVVVAEFALPQNVAYGRNKLRLDFYCNGYTYLQVSEFHSIG